MCFLLLRSVRTDCGTLTASFAEVNGSKRDAVHSASCSASIAWCLFKPRANFTFTFTFSVCYTYSPSFTSLARIFFFLLLSILLVSTSSATYSFILFILAVFDIDIDIFINYIWVVTRWQYTFTHKKYIEQHK